jgi:hypothetical protein
VAVQGTGENLQHDYTTATWTRRFIDDIATVAAVAGTWRPLDIGQLCG